MMIKINLQTKYNQEIKNLKTITGQTKMTHLTFWIKFFIFFLLLTQSI